MIPFHAGEGFFAGMKHIGNNFKRTIYSKVWHNANI